MTALGAPDRGRVSVWRWTVLLPAFAGAAMVMYATAWGPGVGGDATLYLEAARNFSQGEGLGWYGPSGEFEALPYSAPLFPIVLAGLIRLGIDPLVAARGLNAGLLALTAATLGWGLARALRTDWMAPLTAGLIAFSPILLPVFSWAMAEPLFLGLGFSAWIILLIEGRAGAPSRIVPSALAAAGSFLARYLGSVFVAAGAVLTLAERDAPIRKRLFRAGVYLAIGALPALVWIQWAYGASGAVASRSWEPLSGLGLRLTGMFQSLRPVALSWVLPFSWAESPPYPAVLNEVLAWAIGGLVVLGPPMAVWLIRRSYVHADLKRVLAGLAVFQTLYVVTVAAVYLLTYPPITLDSRMLSGLHVGWLILVVLAARATWEATHRAIPRLAMGLAVGLMTASYVARDIRLARQLHQDGLGFTAPRWQASETAAAVRSLPEGLPVITNEVTALLFLARRPAYAVSEIYQRPPGEPPARYGESGSDRAHELFRQGAALVLFDTVADQLDQVRRGSGENWRDRMTEGLIVAFEGADGKIYFFPGADP